MRRIAHLTSVHRPFDTRIFEKECRSLRRFGYQVVLIAPHDRDEVVDGVEVRAIPRRSGRLARMLRSPLDVLKQALAADCDVYHLHDPELLPVAQWLRRRGKHVIYDMHENLPVQLLSKPWIPRMLRGPLRRCVGAAERVLFRRLRIVTAMTEDSFAAHYPWIRDATVLLNLPLHEELVQVDAEKDDVPTVGYIGVISETRGALAMLAALGCLKQAGIEPRLHAVGRVQPAVVERVRDLQSSLGLDNIHWHGYLPPRDGWEIIARCHVGLVVLQPIPNYVEALPTKLFEYMALGIPVVSSDFPLYRSVVDEAGCGLCVKPDDPEDIARALRWLLEHPVEAREMGARGRRAVLDKYNWQAESAKLRALYERIPQQGAERCESGSSINMPTPRSIRPARGTSSWRRSSSGAATSR